MNSTSSVASGLQPLQRQAMAVKVLTKQEPITEIAKEEQVSRKFVYQQQAIAQIALNQAFEKKEPEQEVLYYLPITHSWIFQFILALILICHCSYRGVVELLRDLFDYSLSIGTIHNRVKKATAKARKINHDRDLSSIDVALLDELFQSNRPVLTGVDADSTYCFLLEAVSHRDEDTWGYYLLELEQQGLNPDYTIADGGKGIRAGQKAAWGDKPCHGDVWHIFDQCEALCRNLAKKAQGAITPREKLEQKIKVAKLQGKGNQLSAKLTQARKKMKKSLSTNVYWQKWNQLYQQLSEKFLPVKEAVESAMKSTPRASSLVENLNSCLRNYFFLRKHLNSDYLDLLRFFLNHRTFRSSRVRERVGKSPTELMTGKKHPHWLSLLGFDLFQRA
ncbi:hypothetical protein [Pleurocapsa sp. PCC 7319]|uniref:hypothetical protein n=1 Tax=Pleurocapsa sp. PCC 7319 TaxID=118161 RepID=UPI000349A5C7|nr:hypothetical protein [Pleurocapsa sp. PCC 7319]